METFQAYLIVALGSAVGGCARYGVANVVARRFPGTFPLGTFLVNVTGSFAVALFLTAALSRTNLDPRWRLLVAVGFCGGFTTFSAFAWETGALITGREYMLAAVN